MSKEHMRDMHYLYSSRELSDGGKGDWEQDTREEAEKLLEGTTEILIVEKVIPDRKSLEDWVFLSPSANYRVFENHLLRQVSDLAAGVEYTHPPLFIVSDILGYTDSTEFYYQISRKEVFDKNLPAQIFRPSFKGQLDEVENANSLSIASDAYRLPLQDDSVNVLWDRLGAMWHALNNDIPKHEYEKSLIPLLEEYKRILKSGGCIVVDAYEQTPEGAPTNSTYDFISGTVNRDFPEIIRDQLPPVFEQEWDVRLIGKGKSRMAVLSLK